MTPPPLVIPVVDILNGVVVRGVGGQRDQYRPVISSLVAGSEPLAIAAALRSRCGHSQLYLADLDAILHRRPHDDLYRQLVATGSRLLVDAGVRDVASALSVANCGADVVAGLETVPNADLLAQMIAAVGPNRLVFSLDLRGGQSLGGPGWSADVGHITSDAMAAGVTRLLVLDLADVGTHTGGSTRRLCAEILRRWPDVSVIAGGGVRGPDDLRTWSDIGVSGVLVASALHDGRLTADDLVGITRST